MFRKLSFSLLAAGFAASLASSSQAAIGDGALGARPALADLQQVEKARFFWAGRNYCWYPVGWHGPGWYWCGYGWRTGIGWGGIWGWRPVGWRAWHVRHWRP